MNLEGPYSGFGEMEAAILGMVCQSSGIATASARTKMAAGWKTVLSFGNRRMHPSISGMIDRSAFIGGCDGVSSRMGGDITGTVPHALMILVGSNEEAFRKFDEVVEPEVPRIMLIDTYSDERVAAVEACETLPSLKGIRLDTPGSRRGNFRDLINEIRWELDLHGRPDVDIIVSGGLDEDSVRELADSCVTGFGVGTSISNAPTFDLSMDIVEKDGKPVSKRGKFSGRKYPHRCPHCYSMGVSLSPDQEVRCTCGSTMEMLEAPMLMDGVKVRKDRTPAEIRESVISQLKHISEIESRS